VIDLLLVPTRLEARGLTGETEVPEDIEGTVVRFGSQPFRLVLGGFGLAAAGARAARAIAHHRPRRVILAGIAGSLNEDRAPLTSLIAADRLVVDGLGAGEGPSFLSAESMGFPELPGLPPGPISVANPLIPDAVSGTLLSVAAASDPDMARRRRRAHTAAIAEDMESWAVGLAAHDAGCPLLVLRAISNEAGDRDPARWRVADALARLREGLAALPSPS
jgi:futalosine hydrolase